MSFSRSGSRSSELTAVFAAYFTSFFVMNGLSVSLPRIAADLDGMASYSWAISIPALASAIVTLLFGKLSDLYGRRIILVLSTAFILVGAILCAISRSFSMMVVSLSLLSLGYGAIPPLCFSLLGDLYAPVERGVWAGLLNISSGITAFLVPALSGWLVDHLSWRSIFWLDVPLALLTGVILLFALPVPLDGKEHSIDFRGAVCLAVASSTLILGVSGTGVSSPASAQMIALLGVSAVFWVLFYRVERGIPEPILDPQIVRNRTFITASAAAFASLFGVTAIMVYYPLFLQGVQNVSATRCGLILTPLSVLISFMGVPAGFLIAKTRHYKWMFVAGYAILTMVMAGMLVLRADTATGWGYVIAIAAGLGLGTIPTVNALVVQYAVPKRLLGAATGGLYFFVMMGRSVAPAILGLAMNTVYDRARAAALPASLEEVIGEAALEALTGPRVLLSASAMNELREGLVPAGELAPALFGQTLQAIRSSLASGLQVTFVIGAVAMLVSLLLILTLPEIPLGNDEQN